MGAPSRGHPVAGDVDAQVADLQGFRGVLFGGAQPGTDACHQLRRLERLGDVVVGTGFQAAHHVGGVGLGGEHDDRDVVLGADELADLDAVEARAASSPAAPGPA